MWLVGDQRRNPNFRNPEYFRDRIFSQDQNSGLGTQSSNTTGVRQLLLTAKNYFHVTAIMRACVRACVRACGPHPISRVRGTDTEGESLGRPRLYESEA
jgi:hypothetical protein